MKQIFPRMYSIGRKMSQLSDDGKQSQAIINFHCSSPIQLHIPIKKRGGEQ